MKEKIKNNKYLKPIIVAVVVIVIIIIALISFSSKSGDGAPIYNIDENMAEWAKYLVKQNITAIIYEKADDKGACIEREITKDELKMVLTKMTASRLMKYNYGIQAANCNHRITVKYDNKEFMIEGGYLINANNTDSALIALLDKEELNYIQPDSKEVWMVYEYGWDIKYLDTLFK